MKRLKVLEKEQEILRDAYKVVLSQESSMEIVGVGNGSSLVTGDGETVERTLPETAPDLVLIGTKLIQSSTIVGLETIHSDFRTSVLFSSQRTLTPNA